MFCKRLNANTNSNNMCKDKYFILIFAKKCYKTYLSCVTPQQGWLNLNIFY